MKQFGVKKILSTKFMSKKKFGPKFFWLEKKNLGKKNVCLKILF